MIFRGVVGRTYNGVKIEVEGIDTQVVFENFNYTSLLNGNALIFTNENTTDNIFPSIISIGNFNSIIGQAKEKINNYAVKAEGFFAIYGNANLTISHQLTVVLPGVGINGIHGNDTVKIEKDMYVLLDDAVLSISGGDGTKGGSGENGKDGAILPINRNAENGSIGGNGGVALSVRSLSIMGSLSTVVLTGGSGGQGGVGGKPFEGTKEPLNYGSFTATAGKGGTGGQGGNGGNPGNYGTLVPSLMIETDPSNYFEKDFGAGGNAGGSGNGGVRGKGIGYISHIFKDDEAYLTDTKSDGKNGASGTSGCGHNTASCGHTGVSNVYANLLNNKPYHFGSSYVQINGIHLSESNFGAFEPLTVTVSVTGLPKGDTWLEERLLSVNPANYPPMFQLRHISDRGTVDEITTVLGILRANEITVGSDYFRNLYDGANSPEKMNVTITNPPNFSNAARDDSIELYLEVGSMWRKFAETHYTNDPVNWTKGIDVQLKKGGVKVLENEGNTVNLIYADYGIYSIPVNLISGSDENSITFPGAPYYKISYTSNDVLTELPARQAELEDDMYKIKINAGELAFLGENSEIIVEIWPNDSTYNENTLGVIEKVNLTLSLESPAVIAFMAHQKVVSQFKGIPARIDFWSPQNISIVKSGGYEIKIWEINEEIGIAPENYIMADIPPVFPRLMLHLHGTAAIST